MRNTRQKGFTLVELLIVIGILGALAAVTVPNVSKFVGYGETASQASELQIVQSSLDFYMAELGLQTVPKNETPTKQFDTSVPALYPSYMRSATSDCAYTWDTSGDVSQDCS